MLQYSPDAFGGRVRVGCWVDGQELKDDFLAVGRVRPNVAEGTTTVWKGSLISVGRRLK